MRVKISYGVDIEEIPQELQKLFSHVCEKTIQADSQINLIDRCFCEEDVATSLSIIEKLRVRLAEIDNRLADIQLIAGGYVNYKESEGAENAGEGRLSVDPTGDDPVGKPPEQPTSDSHRTET